MNYGCKWRLLEAIPARVVICYVPSMKDGMCERKKARARASARERESKRGREKEREGVREKERSWKI